MPQQLLTDAEKQQVIAAIKAAELDTSGEIRVHIEKDCSEDVMDRAAFLFKKLKMHQTQLRNGVLFYLAVEDKKFAILGDGGINARVPEGFWDRIKETMTRYFKGGDFANGLATGITMSGEQLKAHFPYQSDDVNELPDDISFGK